MFKKKLYKTYLVVIICYFLIAAAFFLIAGDQLNYRTGQTVMPSALESIGDLCVGNTVRQPFTVQADQIRRINLITATYDRENTSTLQLEIYDVDGSLQYSMQIPMTQLTNGVTTIDFEEPMPINSNEEYELVFSTPDGYAGNTIALMYGNSIDLRQGSVPITIKEEEYVLVNGKELPGKLCAEFEFTQELMYGRYYWYIIGVLGILLIGYLIYLMKKIEKKESTAILRVVSAFYRYNYLLRQLISRDFKTKYKRSILGVFWSFLNPLLSMLVQYIVFSALFKSDIPNFALYLLIGIVCFNFFSEAATMALTSIVGNASLITKVYVPKYIYPVSRVLSSTVNLLLSLLPLFAVMILTGAPINYAILLLPFGLFCLISFSLGVGLCLATAMVFFRDTQFLWGVVSMLWMYATPIIYPETIIPEKFMLIFKCNPLYHIVRFIRIIMMDGISPEPKAYILCLIVSLVPLLIGLFVFKKHQDKFVLNL